MIMKKRKRGVDGEPSSETKKVKDKRISPNAVISSSDHSDSDDSSDDRTDPSDFTDSTDVDTDSSDSEYLKVVIIDDNTENTEFSYKTKTKMTSKQFRDMYLAVRRIKRRNKISNSRRTIHFQIKKRKKITRKGKKKRHENRKADLPKSTNKCNSADKTEPEIQPKPEIVEETLTQPKTPVWVEPPSPQLENPNSAYSLELSDLRDKIISSDRYNEAFLLANVDTSRITIATNNPSSFTRYEDLNNGDLDYIEDTMDLDQAIAEEMAPGNSLEVTERFPGSISQNTRQLPMEIIHDTSFKQEIKYEPELIISEDEQEFGSTKNVPNVTPIKRIEDEPLKVDSKIADKMFSTASMDLERMLIKNEPVEEKPMSSKDVITLSDEEEDHKKPIKENSCEKAIETEKSGENSKKIANHYKNRSKNAEVSCAKQIMENNCKKAIGTKKRESNTKNLVKHCKNLLKNAEFIDDDDLKCHEMLRIQLLNEIRMLSEDENTTHERNAEKDSTNLPKKCNLEETFLSNDYSDYAAKKSVVKNKLGTKIARIESDYEMETTDEEASLGDFLGNRRNESYIKTDCRKVFPENSKNSNKKEANVRPKSWQQIRASDEKISHEEKKSHCDKRSHDGDKAFNGENSSVKEKRSDEKRADKKKTSHENTSRKKSDVENICKEKSDVEKNCKKPKSEAEKICEKEKSEEEISDKLNKSEHKVRSHKSDEKRRYSSEAKSSRISESDNDSKHENSSCAKTVISPVLIPCGNPVVLLRKLNDQIPDSSCSESVNPVKDKCNTKKKCTKSSTKQEAQTLSTRSIDIEENKHKIPTPKHSGSKSTAKSNRDFTLKSKSETKVDLLDNKSPTKQESQTSSTKSVDFLDNKRKILTPEPQFSSCKSEIKQDLDNSKFSTKQEPQLQSKKRLEFPDNKRKVSTPEPKFSFSPLTKKSSRDWTLKSDVESKQSAEKDQQRFKSADSAGKDQQRFKSADSASIDKLNTNKSVQFERETYNEGAMKILFEQSQKKVEEIKTFAINSGVSIVKLQMTMEARGNLVNDDPKKIAKQSVQSKQTSLVDDHFGERDNGNKCSEEKEHKEKSAKLAKEMAVTEKISPADYEKIGNVKTEKKKSLDPDSKESITDEKVTPVNKNDFSRVNAQRRKSLDVTNEFVPKSGMDAANFPHDVGRKPVTSFVGRIPKKNACQSNSPPIAITPNSSENYSACTSNEECNTCEAKSPNENISLSKHIMNIAVRMVKKSQQHNTQKVIPLLPIFPPRIPRTFQQFVHQILHWEPSWFKENNETVIQRLFGENYIGMRPTYEKYADYYRDAETLLALKVLDPLTGDPEKFRFTSSIVKGSIRPRKIPKIDVEMTTLKLDIIISRRDSLKEIYPVDGDLISFNYFTTDELSKFVVENEVFAVVENVRSEIISDRTKFHPNLQHFVPDPYELRTYTVMSKCIHDHTIHVKKLITMTMIPESQYNLQNFLALNNLSHSPLMKYIAYPKVEDYRLPLVFMKYYPLVTKDNLDAQQLDAVARITETATRRDPKICLIEGPPGTGKTKVVINIVRQLIHRSGKTDKNSPFRILVCASSDSAVDDIAMRLLEERQKITKDTGERFRMVRVGCYGNINAKVKEISLEDLAKKEFDRFNDAAMKYDHEKMRKSIQFHNDQDYELRIQKNSAKWYGSRNHIARKLEDNKARWNFLKNRKFGTDNILSGEEITALHKAAESTVLEGAQVIVCTLAYSAKKCMESVFCGTENGFSTCIIDDSTKNSEVETLLPLQLGVKTLILVGDTIQQPYSASIMPGETKLHGFDRSLFARLRQVFADHPENPIIQLRAQYRMAYPIAYWPQQYFYNGILHNCANLRCLPLESFKVMNLNFTQEDNEGLMNEHEGVFVARLVMLLMTRAGLDAFEQPVRIGVITPYHRQEAFLYNEIKHIMDRLPIELKQKIIVDVHTIDGIQGQERDIIIMSCVTSKGTRLLSDKQKLCMALTRAKNSMIICGNFETYWKDQMWESLLTEAHSRYFYVDLSRYTHEDDIVAHVVR